MDILVADCTNNCVSWLRQYPLGQFKEQVLCENIEAPAHLQVIDFTGDGHLDIIVASAYNQWENPEAQSLIWLENDGSMRFRPRDITNRPTHIQALGAADFNADGRPDLVTGGLHTYPPYDRMERVVLWWNRWK